MGRPKSDFDALREDLRNVYDGSPWHGSSIKSVLKGVDADTAALRSIPRGHTIWEIVLHMTGWTLEVAIRNPPARIGQSQNPLVEKRRGTRRSKIWPPRRRSWRAPLTRSSRTTSSAGSATIAIRRSAPGSLSELSYAASSSITPTTRDRSRS